MKQVEEVHERYARRSLQHSPPPLVHVFGGDIELLFGGGMGTEVGWDTRDDVVGVVVVVADVGMDRVEVGKDREGVGWAFMLTSELIFELIFGFGRVSKKGEQRTSCRSPHQAADHAKETSY